MRNHLQNQLGVPVRTVRYGTYRITANFGPGMLLSMVPDARVYAGSARWYVGLENGDKYLCILVFATSTIDCTLLG